MAEITTELDVANRALVRLGAKKITALTEDTDRARACVAEITETRREVLRAYPWNCARKRARLNGYPQAQLTPGAGATTVGASAGFTADAPAFLAGRDEGERILGNGGTARITSVTSSTVAVGVIDTAFASLASIAIEGWRIAPAWGWDFRYPKPAGYLRLAYLEGITVRGRGTPVWSWWRDLNSVEEPVKIEGEYLVSDQGGIVNIAYTQDLPDMTKWDVLALSAYTALLAFRISYAVAGSLQLAKTQHDLYKDILAEARTADGQEGSIDDSGSTVLLDVRW